MKIAHKMALLPLSLLAFTLTAAASPTPASIVLTENSSTSLSYSLDGGASVLVTDTSPDHWTINLEGVEVVTSLGGVQNINAYWKEPDYGTSGLVNYVNFYQYANNGTTITVVSDTTQSQGYPLENNGQTFTFNFSDLQTATFNDNGDGNLNNSFTPTPDGGSTAALLAIGFAGLVVLRRKLA